MTEHQRLEINRLVMELVHTACTLGLVDMGTPKPSSLEAGREMTQTLADQFRDLHRELTEVLNAVPTTGDLH